MIDSHTKITCSPSYPMLVIVLHVMTKSRRGRLGLFSFFKTLVLIFYLYKSLLSISEVK